MAGLSPVALGSLLGLLYPVSDLPAQSLGSISASFNSIFPSEQDKFNAGCALVCASVCVCVWE